MKVRNKADEFQLTDVAVKMRDVNLYYGDFHALKDINMDVTKGEITAFIGPSGCGKSTLLKCINRMNDLVEGCRIEGLFEIGGKNIYAPGTVLQTLRKNVGMVFQKPNPFPMSVYDNITYGPRLYGIRDKATLSEIVEVSLKRAAMWCAELKEKVTIIMVTHNMQQAARISDKTGFFLLGELVEFGTTEQIFSNPAKEQTERYITGRFG